MTRGNTSAPSTGRDTPTPTPTDSEDDPRASELSMAEVTPEMFGCASVDAVPSGTVEFGWRYDVLAGYLPFRYLYHDRMALFLAVADYLADLPPTKRTFTLPEVEEVTGVSYMALVGNPDLRLFFRTHGSFPVPGSYAPVRYTNPNYAHSTRPDAPVRDPVDRLVWVYRYAATGQATLADVGDHFGIEPVGARAFCKRYGIAWRALCARNQRTLARTFYLVNDWTDYCYIDMAAAVGMPVYTLRYWVKKWVRDDPHGGFDVVPPDPSGIRSFERKPPRT